MENDFHVTVFEGVIKVEVVLKSVASTAIDTQSECKVGAFILAAERFYLLGSLLGHTEINLCHGKRIGKVGGRSNTNGKGVLASLTSGIMVLLNTGFVGKMIEQQAGYNYCALPLAAYASRPDKSRGRLHTEEDSKTRTCFQRDRDRIIHSSAFRRLKHKTQVFVVHHGDNFRTRLTHTLEAAQIARSLARALYVNEDLAEGIVLAHDLGHPPFAHLGEDALVKCMKSHGGFEHNDQSLRIVTMLENRYPEWSGLNLTWETLEGIVKHNGPISRITIMMLKMV